MPKPISKRPVVAPPQAEPRGASAVVPEATTPMQKTTWAGTSPQHQVADAFEVRGDQKSGLEGTARPGASIEAINFSAVGTQRLEFTEATSIGKVGPDGHFSNVALPGNQAPREGDLIRVRARNVDGSTTDWLTITAHGLEAADTRNADVSLPRVVLQGTADGRISLTNINPARVISEPGATLRFTNARTGVSETVTLDATGNFPEGTQLKGLPGDSFSVAASDGRNNTGFTTVAGYVTVPGGKTTARELMPAPAMHPEQMNADGTAKFGKANFTGPLFVDGVNANDCRQGQLGDCYFVSALSSIARSQPGLIEKQIKDNGNGTYTVTFHAREWKTMKIVPVAVTVDADLYVRPSGAPVYGASANSTDPARMELWFPVMEKAFASLRQTFGNIGSGGDAGDVLETVTGRNSLYQPVNRATEAKVFALIKRNTDAKIPMCASTRGEHEEPLFINSGLYAGHAYSIQGCTETNGRKFVILRNPWGESEPLGDGTNDGVFKLPLEDFSKMFDMMMCVAAK